MLSRIFVEETDDVVANDHADLGVEFIVPSAWCALVCFDQRIPDLAKIGVNVPLLPEEILGLTNLVDESAAITLSSTGQYSSGSSTVVIDLSHSVMIQTLVPPSVR